MSTAAPASAARGKSLFEVEAEGHVLPRGLALHTVYYLNGAVPKDRRGLWPPYYINNAPHCGYGLGVGIGDDESRRVTLFCPYSFESFSIKPDAGELSTPELVDGDRLKWLVGLLRRKWAEHQGHGFQRDYNTATLVFKKLGEPVPEQIMKGGEEDDRKKGGKETQDSLKKPVRRSSKRGRFLEWFLEGDGSRSVREAMAEFGMTRSNALSYLYMLNKDHGIGYDLVGDTATIHVPDDCDNPFDDVEVPDTKARASESEPVELEEDDDSWLD